MTSKITLYSDKELIEQIKAYAKAHNTSVSKIVNTFFTNLLQVQEPNGSKSTITDRLQGKLKGKEVDEKQYRRYLEEKYLWV